MANEDIKQELLRLQEEEKQALERQEIAREVEKLRRKKWEREHPRLSRLQNFFGQSRF